MTSSGVTASTALNTTSGGGIAMDHGSHTFYLAFDWLVEGPNDWLTYPGGWPGWSG